MHVCVCIRRLTPRAVLRLHTGPSPYVVSNRQTSLASILNDPFPRGEGTGCLVTEHVAGPWYAAGMPFMCWFACFLALDRRVTAAVCPPAGRLDLLINPRVRLSCGSQECSGT